MAINLGLPPIPRFDQSLLPWLRLLVARLDAAFAQFDKRDATAYSPTLSQPGNVTYNTTTSYAWYRIDGQFVSVESVLFVTGAGTANNAISFSLPFPAITAIGQVGGAVGYWYDASAGTIHYFVAQVATTTTVQFGPVNVVTLPFLGAAGSPNAAALANGDKIAISLRYMIP